MDHSKSIKGLSIAVVVLGALGIVFSFVCMALMGLVQTAFESYLYGSGYEFMPDGYSHGHNFYRDELFYDDYSYYGSDIDPAVMMIVSTVMNGLFIWAIVCSAVTLVSGIIGIKFASNPEKLNVVFGWAIVGAVIGFLGTGIIVCVLEIIVAVFANKDKKLHLAGAYGYAAPPQPNMPYYPEYQPTTAEPIPNAPAPNAPMPNTPVVAAPAPYTADPSAPTPDAPSLGTPAPHAPAPETLIASPEEIVMSESTVVEQPPSDKPQDAGASEDESAVRITIVEEDKDNN